MDEGLPFMCSRFLMETFYHQIGYDFCLGIKHSPSELELFKPGMRVPVGYFMDFMEMEEKRQGNTYFISFTPSYLWSNESGIMVEQIEAWRC